MVAVCTLAGVVACARIAGLDEGGSAASPSVGDGGALSTPEGATITPDQLSVTAACGARTDSDGQIFIQNGSAGDLGYSLASSDPTILGFVGPDQSVVAGLKGTVLAGKVAGGFKVSVTSASAGTRPATVIVTVGKTERVLPVNLTVQGGTVTVSPSAVSFGQVRQQTESSQAFNVTNTGTAPVTINDWAGTNGDFSVTGGPLTIQPGTTLPVTTTFSAGVTSVSTLSTMLTPNVAGGLCGGAPTVALSGIRVNTSLTVNGSIDFGDVPCGGSPAQVVTLKNFGPQSHYAFELPANSAYSVDVPDGDVPAGTDAAPRSQTVNLRLTAKNVPQPYNESIVVDTPADATTTKTISVTTTVRGAVLAVTPPTLDFAKKKDQHDLRIVNNGNDFVYLAYATTGGFSVSTVFGAKASYPNYPFGTSATVIAPNASGPYNATLTVSRTDTPFSVISPYPPSGVICNTLAPITLTGGGN